MKRQKAQRPRFVFLAGFMGAGKTTVGKVLARRLRWKFVDLDGVIERREKIKIARIFAELGEPRFRAMETEALRHALQGMKKPAVVALGGGAVTRAENRRMIRASGGTLIWLHAPVGALLGRLRNQRGGAERPLLREEKSFRRLYRQRLRFYAMADHKVRTAGLSASEAAETIVRIAGLGEKKEER